MRPIGSDFLERVARYLRQRQEEGWDWLPGATPECSSPQSEPAPHTTVVTASVNGRWQIFEILDGEVRDCRTCPLHQRRRKTVFGEGSLTSGFVFVGEAPGAEEDLQGRPFVGEAGKLLTKIIEALGFHRDDVYITNIVKCRPPGNRAPLPGEIQACSRHLDRQLEVLQPRVVCALGRISAQTLIETTVPISRLRGKVYNARGLKIVPTYHPAYLLRNPEGKKDTWADVQLARAVYEGKA